MSPGRHFPMARILHALEQELLWEVHPMLLACLFEHLSGPASPMQMDSAGVKLPSSLSTPPSSQGALDVRVALLLFLIGKGRSGGRSVP
jgi:hypothetical protein